MYHIKKGIDEFTSRGSGWILFRVNKLFIEIYKYDPLKGGSYKATPKIIANKKAVINVNNSFSRSTAERSPEK